MQSLQRIAALPLSGGVSRRGAWKRPPVLSWSDRGLQRYFSV